jgi:hypothetical protein
LQFFKFKGALEVFQCARLLAPLNPNYRGFSAIATVMFHLANGKTIYDAKKGLVGDLDGIRPMKSWEKWAYPRAIERIEQITAALEQTDKRPVPDNVIKEPVLI